jgi:Family of unknown function (DUF5906)
MTAIEIETEAKTKNGKRRLSREDKERIKRAAEEKIEIGGHIERLNARHAVVNLAGDVVILTEHAGQPPTFNNPAALHLWYANDLVSNGQQMVPVSQMWLRSKKRRQYDRVVFDPRDDNPRHYNLWRGFAVKPDPAKSCELFLEHVKDNICSGNDEHYRWVLGFLAHMVQRPWEKPGVAVALRGMEGTGKGFFANAVGRLLCPEHYIVISQAAHLTGRFNAHQQQAVLMFVDEGFWAGDRAGEGALKHLVTDHELLIEPKHVNAFMVRNLTRLIIASNESWVVPAGLSARRWCVLDVDPASANDRGYFGAIDAEMRSGGLEALMHLLSKFDLSTVDVYSTPKTTALLEQKEESAAPHVRWWLQFLQEGEIKCTGPSGISEYQWSEVPKAVFWNSYQLFTRDHNIRSRLWPDKQLHKWLKPLLPGLQVTRPRTVGASERQRVLILPSLDECRKAYSKFVGQTVDWEEESPMVQTPVQNDLPLSG